VATRPFQQRIAPQRERRALIRFAIRLLGRGYGLATLGRGYGLATENLLKLRR